MEIYISVAHLDVVTSTAPTPASSPPDQTKPASYMFDHSSLYALFLLLSPSLFSPLGLSLVLSPLFLFSIYFSLFLFSLWAPLSLLRRWTVQSRACHLSFSLLLPLVSFPLSLSLLSFPLLPKSDDARRWWERRWLSRCCCSAVSISSRFHQTRPPSSLVCCPRPQLVCHQNRAHDCNLTQRLGLKAIVAASWPWRVTERE